ncbi:type II toxin-antitoxin system HicA family toxin [Phyllobacterium sp. OV277]|uniref:type II toxin-antitoxin system HicA family toxin n=1 Tax=Phyllobacterium sp. OV277 TaxID=1882772 RepID=UPI000888D6AA|nr:type II toxin-antitoxin system HicA family toxin [Phyllobacterium sp. OV277]SDP07835.1 HicA toxin of toxin-antitoxin [Phyllobacterium sp. OV277]
MTRSDKLVAALKGCNGPFPYKDLARILRSFGYEEKNGSGSARKFFHPDTKAVIAIHEPHPGNEVLPYVVRQVREHLNDRGLI